MGLYTGIDTKKKKVCNQPTMILGVNLFHPLTEASLEMYLYVL